MSIIDKKTLAGMIDHTILKPYALAEEIVSLCKEAIEYGFASVCINPCHVKLVSECLRGSEVKVCTVIGFPLGASHTKVKSFEAQKAVEDGAHEVDMVINIGALKEKNYEFVEEDIKAVVRAGFPAKVKVIIETCYLTDEEKKTACMLAKKAGAHFVKTSTGFGTAGASTQDIALMRSIVGDNMGVKASGGIKTLEDAIKMIDAGANRIGTSSGKGIISEL